MMNFGMCHVRYYVLYYIIEVKDTSPMIPSYNVSIHACVTEEKQCTSTVSYGFHEETWSDTIDETRDFSQSPYLLKVNKHQSLFCTFYYTIIILFDLQQL